MMGKQMFRKLLLILVLASCAQPNATSSDAEEVSKYLNVSASKMNLIFPVVRRGKYQKVSPISRPEFEKLFQDYKCLDSPQMHPLLKPGNNQIWLTMGPVYDHRYQFQGTYSEVEHTKLLDIEADRFQVLSSRIVQWPDASVISQYQELHQLQKGDVEKGHLPYYFEKTKNLSAREGRPNQLPLVDTSPTVKELIHWLNDDMEVSVTDQGWFELADGSLVSAIRGRFVLGGDYPFASEVIFSPEIGLFHDALCRVAMIRYSSVEMTKDHKIFETPFEYELLSSYAD